MPDCVDEQRIDKSIIVDVDHKYILPISIKNTASNNQKKKYEQKIMSLNKVEIKNHLLKEL